MASVNVLCTTQSSFDHGGGVREQLADPDAVFVVLLPGEACICWDRLEAFSVPRSHPGDALAVAHVLRQVLLPNISRIFGL